MVALVGYEAAFAALTFHLYPLLLERGLDTPGVVTVLAVIGPAQVAGRMLVMVFAPNAPGPDCRIGHRDRLPARRGRLRPGAAERRC